MLMTRITPKISVNPDAVRAYSPPLRTPRRRLSAKRLTVGYSKPGGRENLLPPPSSGKDHHAGFGSVGLAPLVATLGGQTMFRWLFCHWTSVNSLPVGRPSASQPNLPSTDWTSWPCSHLISFALSTELVALIAAARTSPAAYASAASEGTRLSLLGYFFRYALTKVALPGTGDSCSQSSDVMVPSPLLASPATQVLVLPGPLAK